MSGNYKDSQTIHLHETSLLAAKPVSLALLSASHRSGVGFFWLVFLLKCSSHMTRQDINTLNRTFCLGFIGCFKQWHEEFSPKLLTNRLAWNGPMLLKIISKHRGRSPPSPGDPVMVCVFPLPVTPYVKRRPRRDRKVMPSRLLSQKKAQL